MTYLFCPILICRLTLLSCRSYEDMIAEGSEKAVKEKGLLRSEGKEYVMKEGDIVLFRFNV